MNRIITFNTAAADLLREAGDLAAEKLSKQTGLRVSRHAAMLAALRVGLAHILDVPVEDLNDPAPDPVLDVDVDEGEVGA